jgi:hypothetical protein
MTPISGSRIGQAVIIGLAGALVLIVIVCARM